jgi:hypothetical protein
MAAGAIVVTAFAVQESRDEAVTRRSDYPGIAVLTAGLASLVLALVEGNAWLGALVAAVGRAEVEERLPAAAALAAGAAWLRIQRGRPVGHRRQGPRRPRRRRSPRAEGARPADSIPRLVQTTQEHSGRGR